MKFNLNDGGREAAGYKGKTGDCVCRAIAIATQKPYQEIYDLINTYSTTEKLRKRMRSKSSARTGVHKHTTRTIMNDLGWTWVPTMGIGTGCKVHLTDDELPSGNLVVSVSKHVTAVLDGILNDTFDCTRDGKRAVYGYWYKPQ